MGANLDLKRLGPQDIAEFFRKDLHRVVSIHTVMFQKLLFQNEELPLELADLFEDVGNRYLDISDRICELHQSPNEANRSCKKIIPLHPKTKD